MKALVLILMAALLPLATACDNELPLQPATRIATVETGPASAKPARRAPATRVTRCGRSEIVLSQCKAGAEPTP